MKRKKPVGTLRRFVARAISDKTKSFLGARTKAKTAHALAGTAIAAVKRGKARGLR